MIAKFKVLLLVVVFSSLTSVWPTQSRAEAEFEPWIFYTGVGSRGTPYCEMIAVTTSKTSGQNLGIRIWRGRDPRLVVSLYKDDWNRPHGSYTTLMFDFLDNEPLSLPALADAHVLEAHIPVPDIAIFLLQVAQRPALQVIFPGGDDGTWIIRRANAAAIVRELISCSKK